MQIRGRKRMVWWPREALDSLYLYPNWHILRRRSRCDPVHPNFRRHPKFEGLSGVEVRLAAAPAAGCERSLWHYSICLLVAGCLVRAAAELPEGCVCLSCQVQKSPGFTPAYMLARPVQLLNRPWAHWTVFGPFVSCGWAKRCERVRRSLSPEIRWCSRATGHTGLRAWT